MASSQSERAVRWTKTDRGFKHYEPIEATRGNVVRVYESSAAEGPHLWVALANPHAHLTLEQATQLRDTLSMAIDRHYQEFDSSTWKAGDPCDMCGSTETELENDIASCRSCGASE